MSRPTSQALPSRLRPPSTSGPSQFPPGSQSPVLLARINEKKEELENLRQLRELSAGLAGQMQALEEKLSTLKDGTEAVAAVLGNWNSVLNAIHMASMKIPKPKDEETTEGQKQEVPLPQTLVRIPAQPQGGAAAREE